MRTVTKSRKSRANAQSRYIERVNRAIDHVMKHLDEPLRLADVSHAAGFSPFHFHRVFQAMTGETLADFVKRRRLDRALTMISDESRKRSLTSIAIACGFSSSSDFSRCFRQRFGVAPSAFDVQQWRADHAAELESVVWKSKPARSERGDRFKVRIRQLPPRTVAYIRVSNPYRGDAVPKAIARLMRWAERRGFADNQWLGYQWENPEIVALEDCTYYVAVEATDFVPRGEIGRFDFPAMTVAQVDIKGGLDLTLRTLQWLYGTWLPRSGYIPDDHPAFEAWIGRPYAYGDQYFEINAQLPIRR